MSPNSTRCHQQMHASSGHRQRLTCAHSQTSRVHAQPPRELQAQARRARMLTASPGTCTDIACANFPVRPECKSWGTPSQGRDKQKEGTGSCRGPGSKRTCAITLPLTMSPVPPFLSLPACVLEPGWGADQAPEGPRVRLPPRWVDVGAEALHSSCLVAQATAAS